MDKSGNLGSVKLKKLVLSFIKKVCGKCKGLGSKDKKCRSGNLENAFYYGRTHECDCHRIYYCECDISLCSIPCKVLIYALYTQPIHMNYGIGGKIWTATN